MVLTLGWETCELAVTREPSEMQKIEAVIRSSTDSKGTGYSLYHTSGAEELDKGPEVTQQLMFSFLYHSSYATPVSFAYDFEERYTMSGWRCSTID